MDKAKGRKFRIILLYALIGWAVCAMTMGVGMAFLPAHIVFVIHALVAPLAFAFLSYHYHKNHHFTEPFQTALIFVSVVGLVDFFLVALVILKSLDMFKSLLGTWIPLVLIFSSTLVVGLFTRKNNV